MSRKGKPKHKRETNAEAIQRIGTEYLELLKAVSRAANVTFDVATGIVARMGQEGYVWEKIKR